MALDRVLTVAGFSPASSPYQPASSDGTLSRLLGAGVAESITVPANAKYMRIAATDNTYINFNATAAVPGDVTDGTAAFLLPAGWVEWIMIIGVVTISVISAGTPVVTASFWRG